MVNIKTAFNFHYWGKTHLNIFAIIFIGIIVFLFFASQLKRPNALIYRPASEYSDLTVTFWPNIAYIQNSLRNFGELPLWRTLIFSGSPFDSDPQSGLWYLPNLIFLFLPVSIGFNVLFAVHALLAGIGMWLWAAETGTTPKGALLAAVIFTLAPKAYAHLGMGHAGLFYAYAYIPWVLWSTYRLGLGQWKFAGIFGLALGMQVIVHPQLAFYTGIVSVIYGLIINRSQAGKWFGLPHRISAPIMGLCLGAVLSLAVSAAQWIPLFRFAPLSARAGMGISDSAVSSIPLNYLWGLILPDYGGFMDYVFYIGIPVLALVILGMKRRQAWFWGLFVILAVIYSLGVNTPLYQWIYPFVPVLAWLRAPSRIWFVAMAAVGLLAGWGLDHLLAGLSETEKRMINLGSVALGSFALIIWLGYEILFGVAPANLKVPGILIPIAGMILFGFGANKITKGQLSIMFMILVIADYWLVDSSFISGRAPQEVLSDNGLAAYLEGQVGNEPFRVYSPSYSLPRQISAQYGLETADGVDPLFLETYDRYMEKAAGAKRLSYGVTVPAMQGGGPISTVNQAAVPDSTLLGLLNVRYVTSEFPINAEGMQEVKKIGSTFVYKNGDYLPRAFVVGNVAVGGNFDRDLEWLGQHDLSQVAIVENGGALTNGPVKAEVNWLKNSPNHLILNVNTDREGFLLISQIWYPGWHAKIDGASSKIWKTDSILSGLYLMPGEHTVEFTYRPAMLYLGLGTSILGVLFCISLIFLSRRV